jgi:hypothetical protein
MRVHGQQRRPQPGEQAFGRIAVQVVLQLSAAHVLDEREISLQTQDVGYAYAKCPQHFVPGEEVLL